MRKGHPVIKTGALILSMFIATHSIAQLKGDHLLGDFGLQAGSQAPPTIIGAVPLYWYNASSLMNDNGDEIADPNIKVFLVGVGGSIVTNLKILKANYGASVLMAFMSNRLEGNKINSSTSLGFSDLFVQPLQLGWHTKRADFTTGYSVYMPTGKYEFGGDDNKGMGMWTHEFSAGSTVFFDAKKTFHFSAIFFYEMHSKKNDTDVKVGDVFTIEGGLGKTFYKKISNFPIPIVFNAGAIYYLQSKATSDKIPIGNTIFTGNKDKIYSWGLEFNVLHPKLRTSLSFRWFDELSARNRFEGNTFLITAGYIIKSLSKHKE